MVDPDLELRVGGGGGEGAEIDLLALPGLLPSVISSFFTQNKAGDGGGGLPAPLL